MLFKPAQRVDGILLEDLLMPLHHLVTAQTSRCAATPVDPGFSGRGGGSTGGLSGLGSSMGFGGLPGGSTGGSPGLGSSMGFGGLPGGSTGGGGRRSPNDFPPCEQAGAVA